MYIFIDIHTHTHIYICIYIINRCIYIHIYAHHCKSLDHAFTYIHEHMPTIHWTHANPTFMPIWSTHTEFFGISMRQRGACSGMWPATKCVGPWLFPLRKHRVVKPAIAWLGCSATGWCHGDCKEDAGENGWVIKVKDLEVVKLDRLRLKQIMCHIHSYPDLSVEQADCCDLQTPSHRNLLLWTCYSTLIALSTIMIKHDETVSIRWPTHDREAVRGIGWSRYCRLAASVGDWCRKYMEILEIPL